VADEATVSASATSHGRQRDHAAERKQAMRPPDETTKRALAHFAGATDWIVR
jgi:hypothetical protein